MRKFVLAAAVVAALLPGLGHADDASYRASVERATVLVLRAQEGSPTAARQALIELRQGTDDTQPEIVADLEADPPDLDDAARRLQALDAALARPADTGDPAYARRQLDSILADHRYDSLRAGPSLYDLLVQWLLQALANLLAAGLSGGSVANILLVIAGAVMVGGIATWLLAALHGRARREATVAGGGERDRLAIDHFAEADRLAALGELSRAVRELAAGVAVRMGGDEAWDSSPLTVRELFKRSANPQALRPLLLAFERAAYAGQSPDQDAYRAASAAAEPYRQRAMAA